MRIDLEQYTDVLNTTANQIKEASEVVQKNPAKALTFIPTLMEQIRELQGFGNLNAISASISSETDTTSFYSAIKSFLANSKEAQEKAGAMGAGFFANPQFQALRDNLEQVKVSLEKGKRVEKSNESHEI